MISFVFRLHRMKKVLGWVLLCREGEGAQDLLLGLGAVTLQLSRLSGAAGAERSSEECGELGISWRALTSCLGTLAVF